MTTKSEAIPTIGEIARRLGEPIHRIAYVIRSRNITPAATAGNARVFTEADVAHIAGELKRIEADKLGLPMIAHADDPAAVKLLLTTEQACEALSVSRRTLYSLTAPRGPIPVVRIGTSGLRYSVAALEQWIATKATEAQPCSNQ